MVIKVQLILKYTIETKKQQIKTTFDTTTSIECLQCHNVVKAIMSKKMIRHLFLKMSLMNCFLVQRKAILSNLMTRRLKIVMPGNFQLTAGKNVNFETPGFRCTRSKGQDGNSRHFNKWKIYYHRNKAYSEFDYKTLRRLLKLRPIPQMM
jgi:hypothetical protein